MLRKNLTTNKLVFSYIPAQSTWLKTKLLGQLKKLEALKREIYWRLHLKNNPIFIDRNKLAPGSIPIIINNYNRLESLKQQVEWLLSLNESLSLIIVDNNSSYHPLLYYYEKINVNPLVQVIKLNYNSWLKGVYHIANQLKDFDKLIITDSDVIPYKTTPANVSRHLAQLLDLYPNYNHVGLSLEITDIPDYYPLKRYVLAHESQFWPPQANCPCHHVTEAAIDSTFAMYRGTSNFKLLKPALRTQRPFTLQHVDWYIHPDELHEEYQFYLAHCHPIATWTYQLLVCT